MILIERSILAFLFIISAASILWMLLFNFFFGNCFSWIIIKRKGAKINETIYYVHRSFAFWSKILLPIFLFAS